MQQTAVGGNSETANSGVAEKGEERRTAGRKAKKEGGATGDGQMRDGWWEQKVWHESERKWGKGRERGHAIRCQT